MSESLEFQVCCLCGYHGDEGVTEEPWRCPDCDRAFTAGSKVEWELWEAEITHWLEAYPEGIFIPPSRPECVLAKNVMLANGLTLDKFSADMARHVLRSLPKRVEERRVGEADDAD